MEAKSLAKLAWFNPCPATKIIVIINIKPLSLSDHHPSSSFIRVFEALDEYRTWISSSRKISSGPVRLTVENQSPIDVTPDLDRHERPAGPQYRSAEQGKVLWILIEAAKGNASGSTSQR